MPAVDGNAVSFDINAKIVVTIHGTAPVNTYRQKVTAQVGDASPTVETTLEGNNEPLEIQCGDGGETVTLGPFTEAKKVTLKFYYIDREEEDDQKSIVRKDKMEEKTSGKTVTSTVPASNKTGDTDLHAIVYVSRTSE